MTPVDSPSAARRWTRLRLAPMFPSGVVDHVELVVSELVTNAFRHGLGPVELDVTASRCLVSVTVVDRGGGSPRIARPRLDGTGGFGLRIVDRLCTRVDVEVDRDRTVVRCTIDADRPGSAVT